MSYETAFYIAIFSGAFWSTIMDSAFPHVFDPLPKPFGCSKCMAFWSTLFSVGSLSYICGDLLLPVVLGSASLAHLTAAFGSRTFRGL